MNHIKLFEDFEHQAYLTTEEMPPDLDMLLFQLFEDEGLECPERFPLVQVPLARFPDVDFNEGDRGEEYAREMVGANELPPIIIAGDKWIDGRHRVWAAKQRGDSFITAIDLADYGIQHYEWELR